MFSNNVFPIIKRACEINMGVHPGAGTEVQVTKRHGKRHVRFKTNGGLKISITANHSGRVLYRNLVLDSDEHFLRLLDQLVLYPLRIIKVIPTNIDEKPTTDLFWIEFNCHYFNEPLMRLVGVSPDTTGFIRQMFDNPDAIYEGAVMSMGADWDGDSNHFPQKDFVHSGYVIPYPEINK